MNVQEPPNCVSRTIQFSAAVVDYIDSEDRGNKVYQTIGGLSKDTQYAWISKGPNFEVVSTDNGEKVAAWTFGGILKDTNTTVTCAVELPTVEDGYGVSLSSLYAVGLDCYLSYGMVCLFDIQGSKIVKAIQVPGKVTSLAVVDPGLIPEATTPLAPPLRLARGVLAVGLAPGGRILLLDLCLSEEDGAVAEGVPSGDEEYVPGMSRSHIEHSDELNPSCVVVYAPGDPRTEGPVAPGEHMAILLNEQSFSNGFFMLKLSDSTYKLPPSHVEITASLYVPQLASLFIGFSFGCFQVWDLGNLTLVHTSSLLSEPRNITYFVFQEPADDPRKYCYIWTVYGKRWDKSGKDGGDKRNVDTSLDDSDNDKDDITFACMHDMYYQSKEWIDAYGFIYQDFVSIRRRFELEFTHSNASSSISRCISCHSIDGNLGRGRAHYVGRLETTDFEDGYTPENDLSICCMVWQSWQVGMDGTPCNLRHSLTLFDLNQWYREQMPSNSDPLVISSPNTNSEEGVEGHPGSPHLVTYSLPFITEKVLATNGVPLLFARIDPTSISRFCAAAIPIPEEHLFPSALSFESSFLIGSQCIIKMSTPGLQRSLLAKLQFLGSKSYLYPTSIFYECITAGLKPLNLDIHNPATTPVPEQREFLLSLALEYHLVTYLIKCAVDTADGRASSLGVTLGFLLNWVKERAWVIKECISKLSVPLFECGGALLPDAQASRLMTLCGRQLKHLSTLLKEILKRRISWILVDVSQEMEQWCDVLGVLALHTEVVQWFCHVGLLPELADEDCAAAEYQASNMGVPRIPYPAKTLAEVYEERRRELQNLPGVSQVSDVLFIDGAVRECGERLTKETWQSRGSNTSGQYPPPSLQALLLTYLLDGLPVEDKHCLVIYLFLDLAALLSNERYGSSISQLIKFPSAFSLSPSIIKLTQAFWLLDHKDFEVAINMFLDPLICPQDIKLWQHRCVVRAFLSQGEPQKALKYVRVRQPPLGGIEDLKLNLTLLLENGLVHEAFNYQRNHCNDQNSQELLQHFFSGCGDLKQLRWVLQNSLTPSEEDGLIAFLSSQKDVKAQDLCVMYYLQRSRVIEALRVRNSEKPIKKKSKGVDNVSVNNVIVNGYASALPSVTRQLATYCAQHSGTLNKWKEVTRPVPMSVTIHHAQEESSASFRTKSTLIGTMLDKARETWNPPPLPPILPPTPRPPPSHHSIRSREKRKRDADEGLDLMSLLPSRKLLFSPMRSSVDTMPFICTPVAPSHSRSRNGDGLPLVFPSQSKSLADFEENSATPFKRPCLSHEIVTSSPVETHNASNMNQTSRNAALLLLTSPSVPRKNRGAAHVDRSFGDEYSSTASDGSSPTHKLPPPTPQSILKVRKARNSSMYSPSFSCNSPCDAENEELPETPEEGQGLGRLIRFQLPSGLTPSPPIASPLLHKDYSQRERLGVTPRQPLQRIALANLGRQSPSRMQNQPSPSKKTAMITETRTEISSTTKTKIKFNQELKLEEETNDNEVEESWAPKPRSSIHIHEDSSSKNLHSEGGSANDSGEFYSFEEEIAVETREDDAKADIEEETLQDKTVLTDSYKKLFASPSREIKQRRQTSLFKQFEEMEEDEEESLVEEPKDVTIKETEAIQEDTEGVKELVGEEVKELVGEEVKELVGEEVKELVGEEVKELVGEEVKELVGEEVKELVREEVKELVREEVKELVGEEVEELVGEKVKELVEEEVKEFIKEKENVSDNEGEKGAKELEAAEDEVEEEVKMDKTVREETKDVTEKEEIAEEVGNEVQTKVMEEEREEEDAREKENDLECDQVGGEVEDNSYREVAYEADDNEVLELGTSDIYADEQEENEEGLAKLSNVEEVPDYEEDEGKEEEREEGEDDLEDGEYQVEGRYGGKKVPSSVDVVPSKPASDDDDVVVISDSEEEEQYQEERDEDEDEEIKMHGSEMGTEEENWEDDEYAEELEGYNKEEEEIGVMEANNGEGKESWMSQWERESGIKEMMWTDQEREEVELEDGEERTSEDMPASSCDLKVRGGKSQVEGRKLHGKSILAEWVKESGLDESRFEDEMDEEEILDEDEEEDDDDDEEEDDDEEDDEDDEEEDDEYDDDEEEDVEEYEEEEEEDEIEEVKNVILEVEEKERFKMHARKAVSKGKVNKKGWLVIEEEENLSEKDGNSEAEIEEIFDEDIIREDEDASNAIVKEMEGGDRERKEMEDEGNEEREKIAEEEIDEEDKEISEEVEGIEEGDEVIPEKEVEDVEEIEDVKVGEIDENVDKRVEEEADVLEVDEVKNIEESESTERVEIFEQKVREDEVRKTEKEVVIQDEVRNTGEKVEMEVKGNDEKEVEQETVMQEVFKSENTVETGESVKVAILEGRSVKEEEVQEQEQEEVKQEEIKIVGEAPGGIEGDGMEKVKESNVMDVEIDEDKCEASITAEMKGEEMESGDKNKVVEVDVEKEVDEPAGRKGDFESKEKDHAPEEKGKETMKTQLADDGSGSLDKSPNKDSQKEANEDTEMVLLLESDNEENSKEDEVLVDESQVYTGYTNLETIIEATVEEDLTNETLGKDKNIIEESSFKVISGSFGKDQQVEVVEESMLEQKVDTSKDPSENSVKVEEMKEDSKVESIMEVKNNLEHDEQSEKFEMKEKHVSIKKETSEVESVGSEGVLSVDKEEQDDIDDDQRLSEWVANRKERKRKTLEKNMEMEECIVVPEQVAMKANQLAEGEVLMVVEDVEKEPTINVQVTEQSITTNLVAEKEEKLEISEKGVKSSDNLLEPKQTPQIETGKKIIEDIGVKNVEGVTKVEKDPAESADGSLASTSMAASSGIKAIESSKVDETKEMAQESLKENESITRMDSNSITLKELQTEESKTEIVSSETEGETAKEDDGKEDSEMSSQMEEYATSRRLTRHQRSLLSRSIGGMEIPLSPSSPISAKKKTTRAKTSPRSAQQQVSETSPSSTPTLTSMPTTPLRSSARIRNLGTKTKTEKTPLAAAAQQSESEEKVSSSVENFPIDTASSDQDVLAESKGVHDVGKSDTSEKTSPVMWSSQLEERFRKLKRGSHAVDHVANRTRQSSMASVSPHSSASTEIRQSPELRESPENRLLSSEGEQFIRRDSPTPSVASSRASSVSQRGRRKVTKGKVIEVAEDERHMSPVDEVTRSARTRRRSVEPDASTIRRSRRLSRGTSLSPVNNSESEDGSSYASSLTSIRSHQSQTLEEMEGEGTGLTLRSGKKRARPPAVTPTKSGPRKKRSSRTSIARLLDMQKEGDEDEGTLEKLSSAKNLDTAFVFSPPTAVASSSEGLEQVKEVHEFPLSPPKLVHGPPVVHGHRRSTMYSRKSVTSLGPIPEAGDEDEEIPATPPRKRGRPSLASKLKSSKGPKSQPASWMTPKKDKGKSKKESEEHLEEQSNQEVPKPGSSVGGRRTRRSSLSLQPIEELKSEEELSEKQGSKGLKSILRRKRTSPASSVVSEGALDHEDDDDSKDGEESNRTKDDSDVLPRRRKSSSRSSLLSRKSIMPYKPRKSAKL